MIDISGEWSGEITGTNNANVFAEFTQDDTHIQGNARINDHVHGIAVYTVSGSLSGSTIQTELHPEKNFLYKTTHGVVTVHATLYENSKINGFWTSTIGTAGKVFLKRTQPTTASPAKSEIKHSDVKKIFVSYSHKDSIHLDRLHVHLRPLEKLGLVEVWDDTKIKVGDHWEKKIEAALSQAGIAILIISADFLASDFIVDNELPPILERAQREGTKIIPVILKPCRFSRDPNISKFQALNPPDKPIMEMDEIEQEKTWDNLSELIEKLVDV